MDVDHPLKLRTEFIRRYYATAVVPFETIKSQIENGDPPYEPPYSEDGEPPFLEEWLDADTSLQIVGRACISMLSESLKMYLQTWERLFGVECQRALPAFFKKGFWPGYKECFGQLVPLDWSACPADLSVIEQIVVARNTSQHHTGDIGTLTIRHPPNLREKFERPIFIHEHEKGWSEEDRVDLAWFGSELVITKETLDEAVGQAEFLVEWLEPQLQERR